MIDTTTTAPTTAPDFSEESSDVSNLHTEGLYSLLLKTFRESWFNKHHTFHESHDLLSELREECDRRNCSHLYKKAFENFDDRYIKEDT